MGRVVMRNSILFGGRAVLAEQGRRGGWACGVCTYLHVESEVSYLFCAMCDTAKAGQA